MKKSKGYAIALMQWNTF